MEWVVWVYDTAVGEYKDREAIWIWSIDSDGGYHLIIDPNFRDYFYIDSRYIDVRELNQILRMELGNLYRDIEVDEVTRKLYGVENKFYKISGGFEAVKKASGVLSKKVGEGIYEDDIRPSQKYIMDMNLNPCGWYRYKVSNVTTIDNVSVGVLEEFTPVEERPHPEVRVFSIDVILGSKYGEPDPEYDQVLGIMTYDGENVNNYLLDGNDYNIIRLLETDVSRVDPHVIVGFELNQYILPYLTERLKKLRRGLKIGKIGSEAHQSVLGHFSVGGRINIDLKEYVDDLPIFQRKTLEELAGYMKMDLPEHAIDKYLYYDYWSRDREKLIKYVEWRVKAIYNAFKGLEDHIFVLSNITGIPPDYVFTASSGRQAEYYIMKIARRRGEVTPKVGLRRYRTYPGGLVLNPKPGLHDNIAVIDYKSMYPSIMIKYNISPETIVKSSEGNVIYFDEIGYGVRSDVRGLIPTILEELIRRRDEIRSRLKNLEPSSREYKLLDARQRVLKILANTMYGYMGWIGARWYSYEGASIVTYLGRRTISLSIDKARELRLNIIYGDTDSIFVDYNIKLINELIKWVSDTLGLEAKIDKVFKKILFTEAKKRYAGLTEDGSIEIVGLEYVRRDWCDYAREAQYVIVKNLLEGASKDKLLNLFRDFVRRLRRKEVDIRKLIIWEQITRPLSEYKVNAPHIEVAKRLSQGGWRIKKGMFIGYVINKGSGPLYKRAVHYTKADPNYIDWDYYIYNQLLPAIVRILSPVGIGEKTLESIARGGGVGLDMFV